MEEFRGSASPECPHFGDCGGCMMQDIAYHDQLTIKKNYLNQVFGPVGMVEEVAGAEPYRYRNRMDMVAAFGKLGLRRAGSYRTVVDVTRCPLMQETSNGNFMRARPQLLEVEGYDYLRHNGYLRYAVFRQGYFTGQSMVHFITAARENRLAGVIDLLGGITSLSLHFNDGMADTSFGEAYEVVRGGYIEESLEGVRFRITPNSFFQSNSPVALAMYRRIRDSVQGRVLDLYSGVGSISLFVAGRAESVTGVEEIAEAVECAGVNRGINGIENVSFICADARAYLKESAQSYDTVILDPPRSGIHPKMVRYLNESGPGVLIYMSCSPANFAMDTVNLERYSLQWIEAYDMFPQTPHVETLALFRRI